ncbi:MAG: FHA domain-containing protein, partial [Gammaproteobacteria bacterium]|nr:FHA domain-containing protein [Gammaproteobacteria bacterium]
NDYGWRSLFNALIEALPKSAPYARAALGHYLEYLKAREVLAHSTLQPSSKFHPNATQLAVELNATGERPLTVNYGFRQVRLPSARAVELDIKPGSRLNISMADYPLQLWFERCWNFALPDGQTYRVEAGTCSVGRDPSCQLVVKPAVLSVSRRHLEVTALSERRVRVRDLSSMGSYVDPQSLVDRPDQDVTEK